MLGFVTFPRIEGFKMVEMVESVGNDRNESQHGYLIFLLIIIRGSELLVISGYLALNNITIFRGSLLLRFIQG